MVELRCTVVSVGMVVGGRGAPWCCQPVGRRSCFDPCMPSWFGVGRLACGLSMVVSLFLQLSGWCLVVLAALWSACSWFGLFCCCWRCHVLGCCVDNLCSVGSFARRPACAQPVMVSRCVLGLALAGMSDAGFVVLRPGCGRRVVLVRRCRSRTRSACRGLCCRPHWVGRPCAPRVWFLWLLCCRQHCAWPDSLPWRRLRRLMASLSCCRVCWAMVAIGGRLQLCGGARSPSCWGVLLSCVAQLMVWRGAAVYCPPHVRACCGGVWHPSWWGVLLSLCAPPHCGAWCGGVWSPAWWGVVWRCVAPRTVGRAA